MVDQSAHTNSAQLVSREDGTVIVPQYVWVGFFQPYYRRLAFDGIKSFQHLVFSSATPGKAKVRVNCNAEEKTINLLKDDHLGWNPHPNNLPPILPPPGIPQARRKYLFEKIREFVPESHRDTVCPHYTTPEIATPPPAPVRATPPPALATPLPATPSSTPSIIKSALPAPQGLSHTILTALLTFTSICPEKFSYLKTCSCPPPPPPQIVNPTPPLFCLEALTVQDT